MASGQPLGIAEETGKYQHHAIEFCLAHQLPNKSKAYLRTDLFQQRKIIMNDWKKYIRDNLDFIY